MHIIRHVKNLLTEEALKALYYLLIHSHLLYCIQIWSSASLSTFSDLVKKQKYAIRLIHNAAYKSHTENLFKKSEILPLNLLIDYFRSQFMHQYLNKFLPVTFIGEWSTNAERRIDLGGPVLRNVLDFYVPNSCLVFSERQPLICFPKTWNDLVPIEIKLIPEKLVFNHSMKNHLLNSLSADYTCTRLLCPHFHL